jgi:hypothetical protein
MWLPGNLEKGLCSYTDTSMALGNIQTIYFFQALSERASFGPRTFRFEESIFWVEKPFKED